MRKRALVLHSVLYEKTSQKKGINLYKMIIKSIKSIKIDKNN